MSDRGARARQVVLAAMVGNVVCALLLWGGLHLARPSITARFVEGFPGDMVLVKNLADAPLVGVQLVMDERYVARAGRLPPGLSEFEVRREFEDATGAAPPRGYRPQRLQVIHQRGRVDIPVDLPDAR